MVNFNNGNVNWNNRNNSARLRLCRLSAASECQGVTLKELRGAYRRARRNKKPSYDQVRFGTRRIEHLIRLRKEINAGTWSPSRCTLSVAIRPKARQIHAPAFRDRVVHHLLIPQLTKVYEPIFIHDSFSNRKGKGTNAAVNRLRQFVRQVHSGQGGGWSLKLDIKNFFNTIWRRKLWEQLKGQMGRSGVPEVTQRAVHALIRRPPLAAGVHYAASAAEQAMVPAHKRLENAAPGRGITIGNLSSQFFANVYLNELDQFVKHVLKAKRYVRYVDDFVIIHQDRAQLQAWKVQIEQFLRDRLRLELKDEGELKPLTLGIDFLGYVVKPTHTTVRRRVVSHAREKLSLWERQHVGSGFARATPEQYRHLNSIWASYGRGHFSHANSHRLIQDFHRRYPWLQPLTGVKRHFHSRLEGRHVKVKLRGGA